MSWNSDNTPMMICSADELMMLFYRWTDILIYTFDDFFSYRWINILMIHDLFCRWIDILMIHLTWFVLQMNWYIFLMTHNLLFSRWIDVEWKGGPGTVRSLVRIGEWMPPIGHIMAVPKGWNPRAKSWGAGTLAVISNKDPVKINIGQGPPPPAWTQTLR